eukprot:348063-Pyramimonas_sp.AAC.1
MACTHVPALFRPSATMRLLSEQGGGKVGNPHHDIYMNRKNGMATSTILRKAAVLWRGTTGVDRPSLQVSATSRPGNEDFVARKLRKHQIGRRIVTERDTTRRAINNIVFADGKFNPSGGRIDIICGPMFSGKTTELLARVSAAQFCRTQYEIKKYVITWRFLTFYLAPYLIGVPRGSVVGAVRGDLVGRRPGSAT